MKVKELVDSLRDTLTKSEDYRLFDILHDVNAEEQVDKRGDTVGDEEAQTLKGQNGDLKAKVVVETWASRGGA